MIPSISLSDDGTLDTVFSCDDCGESLRYAGDTHERDEDGALSDEPATLESVRAEHADECPALICYLQEHADVEIGATQEDIPVRGNALASGDDEEDKRAEDAILARLDSGDVWAWAQVEVRATIEGYSGSDYLGACSYENERDFRQSGGYFDDMRETALRALADRLESERAKLASFFAEVEGSAE